MTAFFFFFSTPHSDLNSPNSPKNPLGPNSLHGSGQAQSIQVGYFQSILDSVPLEDSRSTGGTLWFPTSCPDPLYILPILLSLTMYANLKVHLPLPSA